MIWMKHLFRNLNLFLEHPEIIIIKKLIPSIWKYFYKGQKCFIELFPYRIYLVRECYGTNQ
jgi:hypothetical protein